MFKMLSETKIKKIVSHLHNENLNVQKLSASKLTVKLKNICIMNDIKIEDSKISNLAEHIKKYGLNELKISLADFLKMFKVSFNRSHLRQFKEDYSFIHKQISKLFEICFSKKQIGSLYDLFMYHRPKNISTWRKLVEKEYGEDIQIQIDNMTSRLLKMTTFFSSRPAKRKTRKEMESYAYNFLIINTFYGFVFQFGSLQCVAKKLKLSYRFGTDDEDSKGIDGYIGKKAVNVKPFSYCYSSGQKYLDKNIPLVFYELTDSHVIINYEQIMVNK